MIKADNLFHIISNTSKKCIECRLCLKECAFLRKYGSPKSIADAYENMSGLNSVVAFECSLCGLCAAVCPVGVRPDKMFLEIRRNACHAGTGHFPEHSGILNYEKRGTSKRYTGYALPENCDTVFFPGCTLSGTRPDKVKRLFEHMKKTIPGLGIVLDCCIKPSHDLGRLYFFEETFGNMRARLIGKGVRNILVACPSCYRTFADHGGELSVKTIYEVLLETVLPETGSVSGSVVVHDPCAVRFETAIHQAVRKLVESRGLTVSEMMHHGNKTLCCGEGGSVGFVSRELAANWRSIRKNEAAGQHMITYCAGCANTLHIITPVCHILDLLFEPHAALSGKVRRYRAPLTYWNRIRLKHWVKRL